MDAKELITLAGEWIEPSLKKVFPEELSEDITVKASMYSLLAGGKRIRPCLMYLFGSLLGCNLNEVLPYATSLEMIHTYSLIHDDLPCMDDDDLRRGKPTCHKVYGEGIALLAGDNLLNRAYEILFKECMSGDLAKIRAASYIASKAGIEGMIGGQSIDLDSEDKTIDTDLLYELQDKKTGALLSAACMIPCFLKEASAEVASQVMEYAMHIGLLFQIKDDILDVEADPSLLGKSTGKDERDHKSTFVTLLGMEEAQSRMNGEYQGCLDNLAALESLGYDITDLKIITEFLAERKY